MDHSNVTITLPLTGHGLGVILTALGIGVGTGIVWLLLSEQGRAPRGTATSLLGAFAVVMAPIWLVIFAGTLWQVWLMLSGAPSASGSGPSLGMGALLAALLGAPFLVWGTVLKQRNTEIQHRLAELNDAALFNDKISAASNNLTARKQVTRASGTGTHETILTEWQDDLVARASAIDRLEGLAQERPTEVPRIARMLSVYLRELSRSYAAKGKSDVDDGYTPFFQHWSEELKPARSDLEKAMQTLGRLTTTLCDDESLSSLDLRDVNLQGFNLREMNLKQAFLQNARMEGADLSGAHLEGAELSQAFLKGADLTLSKLEAADLSFTDLEGAKISFANIENENLSGADLGQADLSFSNMRGADLDGARMDSDTSLIATTLSSAAMRNVDYANVPISADQVNASFGDASVILPAGIDRPAHWPDWELPSGGEHAFLDEWRKWQADPEGYTPPPKPEG
jgi:uncharacterized protein YjbI with pentapeptide repeats